MIIKFDHITYVEERQLREELFDRKKINTFSFIELGLRNINIKKNLMRTWQEDHDLYFCENESYFPVEYIFYNTVGKNTNVTIKNDVIEGCYKTKEGACLFLDSIFGKKCITNGDKIVYNMKGILDKQDFWLELIPGYSDSVYLDDKGGCTIALITSSPYKPCIQNLIFTGYEKLIVNHRNLNICFVKSDEVNIIFELIMVERK